MPWWAYLYLVVFLLLTIGGISDDLNRPNKALFVSGEVVSAAMVVFFVVAFFYPSIGSTLGMSIFGMVAAGVVYELAATHRAVQDHQNSPDSDISEKEDSVLINFALISGNLIVVPGYVFGLVVGLRNASV